MLFGGFKNMALKDTVKKMYTLLEDLAKDLVKAEKGNKTASQRVRTGTIKLAKIAKFYRKESVQAEGGGAKKPKAVKKKAAVSKKTKTAPKKRR